MEDVCKVNTAAAAAAAAAGEFCEWVQNEIDTHIPYHKYQVQNKQSIWFPTACAAAVAHENCFLCFRQQNKSSASKLKFRHCDNYYKKILEAVNLAYTNK